MRPRIIVFASGTKDGGGSGFQELVENSRTGVLDAEIVAVVSNIEYGGVSQKSVKLSVPFVYFPGPYTAQDYQKIIKEWQADWVALSGWLRMVKGLDPARTINIHPAPLPRFGGKSMYGHKVHEAVIAAFQRGEIAVSAVTMHFVTQEFDRGPIFFRYPVLIRNDDTPETLVERIKKIEHSWQSWVTNLVVQDRIRWNGKDPTSLKVPSWYKKMFLLSSERVQ